MKKKKKSLIAASIAVLLVGFGGYISYAKSKEKEQIQQEQIQKQVNTIQTLQSNVDKLYKDSKKEFLSENITKENIEFVQNEFKKQEKIDFIAENKKKLQQVSKNIRNAKSMFELQSSVKILLDDMGVLSESANIDMAVKQAEELKKVKDRFVDEQQKIIDEAQKQQAEILNVAAAIDNLFTTPEKMEVKEDVTREMYHVVSTALENIKQAKKKEELSTNLSQVDQVLKDREEADSKKNQEEEKQKATEVENKRVQKQITKSQGGKLATSSNKASAPSKVAPSSNTTMSSTTTSQSTPSSNVLAPNKSKTSNNTQHLVNRTKQ